MQQQRQSGGFTIIELLVVVAVIAILLSFIMPSVAVLNHQVQCTICQANERTLLGAISAYTSDNSGFFPIPSVVREQNPMVAWELTDVGVADFTKGTLLPYIASSPDKRAKILWCPGDNKECYPTLGGPVNVDRNFTYSLNSNVRWNWSNWPPQTLALNRIIKPALHVLVYEEFGPNDGFCCGPGDADDWLTGRHGPYGSTQYRSNYGSIAWRIDGKGNVGYFDGHVALMSVSEYFGNSYHWGPLTR